MSTYNPQVQVDALPADGELVQAALLGNQEAFDGLVTRYSTPLRRFIYHYIRDEDQVWDILQQVHLQLYLSLPTLHSGKSLRSWLFQVAHNYCIDELRRRRTVRFSDLGEGSDDEETGYLFALPDTKPLPDEVAEKHDMQYRIGTAIGRLPQKFQKIVWLRYHSQLSFPEIGRILGISEATAKTYFQRAKVYLRMSLTTLYYQT